MYCGFENLTFTEGVYTLLLQLVQEQARKVVGWGVKKLGHINARPRAGAVSRGVGRQEVGSHQRTERKQLEKKSNFHYTRNITPKRVTRAESISAA